ncbi:oligoketide cyclase/lipid transport protein [Mycobacterium bohemicum DSM 44277]|uniref:Cyclase n=2 Tax=Mycobacterium bohemicum TaxID=56425 RepID=A0A1X1QXN1_MYCBE|nr:SRPBCC family protein [Mycobacterium bohemicum]MCV6969196.1 SRPBCC family protein [Mycobacterium bohemicum]ORU96214.1 cyclase [Mycobacterium bohemicum]CPR11492.1 oligoketide cyclase/lipid transport protein [Mycobacterium bohemicum DSM 44277]
MAVKESREVVIEASPNEILDVVADVETMPEWSSIHQSAEVLERDANGRPLRARMKVKTSGVTDEVVLAYTWSDDGVTWTQESGKASRNQEGSYALTPQGDNTRTKFNLELDPLVPLPGFVMKRAIKGIMEINTDGLRKQVLKVKKGK